MDQITLHISDNVQRAMDQAFDEAQQYLTSNGGFQPFTVTVVDEGLEINTHEGDTPEAIRESVKGLLAVDMPEGYALAYDGYIETDDGTLDAIIVEVAERGATKADALAVIYTAEADGTYTFEPSYGYIGTEAQLYPAGTKPIVSGLAALEDEDAPAEEELAEQAAGEEPADGEPGAASDEECACAGEEPATEAAEAAEDSALQAADEPAEDPSSK